MIDNTLNKKSLFRGITRNIFILGVVSLLTDLSSQMVFPLIPLFLTGILHSGAYAVGLIEGAAETTASLLKMLSGHWSDKMKKRKPFVLWGYSLSTITKPLFAFAYSWPFVLFARVIERIGKGMRNAPRDAIVADSCEEGLRGKAYGFQRAMDGAGSVLGALCAYLFLHHFALNNQESVYRKIFLLAFLPGILGVIAIFFVDEKEPRPREKKETANFSFFANMKLLPRHLVLFLIVSGIFALGQFGYAFLLLRAKNIGFSDANALLLYVLFYMTYTVFSVPAGILSDKLGRKPVLMAGYLAFAIISLGLVFIDGKTGLAVFFMIYGLFFALTDGVQRAYVADLAPADLKATSLGAFHTAIGIAALPGGFFAGILWDKIGPSATFLYGSVLSLLSFVLFLMVKKPAAKEKIKT
jgi:MFS family permease